MYKLVCWLGLAAGLWLSSAPNVRAEPSNAATTKPAQKPCEGGTLEQLSCGLARDLTEPPEPGLVIAKARQKGGGAPDELALRAAKLLAGHLGWGVHPRTTSLSEALLVARRHRSLVFVQLTLKGGLVQASADLYRPKRSIWLRVKTPNPGVIEHAFAEAALDAEVRSFLPRVPLVANNVVRASSDLLSPLALSCGDLDQDRSLEFAIVSRQTIRLARIRNNSLQTLKKQLWQTLSEVHATPLREPIATVEMRGRLLEVGSTDRRHAVRLDPDLKRLSEFSGLPWPGNGCAKVDGLGLSPRPQPCDGLRPAHGRIAIELPSTERLDALASARYSDVSGKLVEVAAFREQTSGRLRLLDSRKNEASLSDVGAQVALGDLDHDGYIEVLVSRSTLDIEKDALSVYTWMPEGLRLRYTLPVPVGVLALAVCPPEDEGLLPIAIAGKRALWVVR